MKEVKKLLFFLSWLLVAQHIPVLSIAQWLDTENLQSQRSRLSSVTVGTKVYFGGGCGSASPVSHIDVYDNTTGEITSLSPGLSVARCDLVAVHSLATNKIYFAGGNTNSSPSSLIEVYNLTSNSWEPSFNMPGARAWHCGAAVGNKLIFAGGSANGTFYSEVFVYNTNTSSWQTFSLSEARDQIGLAVVDDKIIMAGGHKGGNVYSKKIDIFNAASNTMESTSLELSSPRAFMGSAKHNSLVFFGGGREGSAASNKVDAFNFANTPVTQTSHSLSTARYYVGGTSVSGKIFFAGGVVNSTTGSAVVDIFDASDGPPTGGPLVTALSNARTTLVAAAVGTKALFAGGQYVGPNYSEVVDIYDTETTKPTGTPTLPADGSSSAAYNTELKITFSEKIRVGAGNIIIKESGSAKYTIAANDPRVTISGTTVTITHPGFVSGSVISVEIPDGVFKDLAGNTSESIGTGKWDFTIAEVITVTSNYKDTYLNGANELKVNVTLSDYQKASAVTLKSWGISEPEPGGDPITLTLNGNIYEKVFSLLELDDPIGVYYVFEVTDITGKKIRIPKRTYVAYTDESSDQIPGLTPGKSATDYELIAIPIELTDKNALSVFNFSTYDDDIWRLYQYISNGDDGKNQEYNVASFSINPGVGYWLITRDAPVIKPGAGTATKFDNEQTNTPFQITLKPGWNLIGNPYNFDLSWGDVLEANPNADLEDEVGVYLGGANLEQRNKIGRYKGAFVYNKASQIEITIPVVLDPDIQGRKASPAEIDISSYSWKLPMKLSDGTQTNSTGGIGMNKRATLTGKDNFDRLPVPTIFEMFEMVFPHPEVGKAFVRDIVPPSENFLWHFNLNKSSDKPLSISWDYTLIKDTEKELYLLDPSFGVIKNMKEEGSYTIPSSTTSLKVVFGEPSFINKTMDELMPSTGYPYPNPAIDEVRIPFRVPSKAGKMKVIIRVYSSKGTAVSTLADGEFEAGTHEVVWKSFGKSGLYLINMKIGTEQSKWAKVIVK